LEDYNSVLEEQKNVKTASKEEEKKKGTEVLEKISMLKGEKGDKGDKGDEGKQGIQGKQGERGEQGLVGNQGKQGLRGLRGDKGEQGEQGTEGKSGKDGKTLLMPNIKKAVAKQLDEVKPEIIKAVVEDSADLVMKNPSLVGMPAFRSMGMGLRGDMDKLEIEKITGIGTHKITVGTTEPSNPAVGNLWIDTN
jgi:hypothetical protein